MSGVGGLRPACPRGRRSPADAGGRGMSQDRPAKVLGMGLSALLGESARPAPAPDAEPRGVREIDIARIKANPNQPRVQFDEDALEELAESIRQRGVLQPILLRPDGDNFEIVAGERRWR